MTRDLPKISRIELAQVGKAWTASANVVYQCDNGEGGRVALRVAGKTQAGAIKNLEEDAATLQVK